MVNGSPIFLKISYCKTPQYYHQPPNSRYDIRATVTNPPFFTYLMSSVLVRRAIIQQDTQSDYSSGLFKKIFDK